MKTPDNKHIPCYPERLFTKLDTTYCAESSDLQKFPTPIAAFVWDDSCDVGFWMQTERGSELFTLVDAVESKDGETSYWVFLSANDNKTCCTIFND